MDSTENKDPPKSAAGDDLAHVLPDNGPWYTKSHLVKLNIFTVSMGMLAAALGYDGSMMNGLMALPQWFEFMNHPAGAWLGFINAVAFLSAAIFYPVAAWCANRYGRKPGLYAGYVFLFLGALLQAFAPNDTAFILGRMFLGLPSVWWGVSGPLLVTELAYPTHRAFLTSLYNCGYYFGSILSAWITYGTRNYDDWSWRIPSLLQIGIPTVLIPIVLFIPESPRFFVAKDRNEEARAILVKYHAGGDEQSLLVQFEMTEMEQSIKSDAQNTAKTSWLDLVRGKGNRHRTLISISLGVFAQWNGAGIVSYYLAMVLKSAGIAGVTEQTLISGFLQIWNLIAAVSAAACVDRLGRRPLFLTSCIGMFTTYVVISALSGSFATTGAKSVGLAVVPMLFIYYAFYDIAFTPLIVAYPAEIWPYELRSRGLALTFMSTYIALFFNIFVNPIALEAIGWKYYIVFAVILVGITATVYFFYPETKGHTLEEMAIVFDGADAPTTGVEALEVVISRKNSVTKMEGA